MKKISWIICLALFLTVLGMNYQVPGAEAASLTTPNLTSNQVILPADTTRLPEKTNTSDSKLPVLKPGTTGQIIIDPDDIPTFDLKDVFLNYPRGGQTFQMGQTIVVKFTVKNAGSYTVYESYNAGSSWTAVNNGTITTDKVGYVPYKTYKTGTLRIKVVSAADTTKSDAGNDCIVTADPWNGKLKAAAAYKTVTLSWGALACGQAEISTYDVYRNTSPNFDSSNLLTKCILPNNFPAGGTETFTDNDVINGTKYYYKVIPIIGGHGNDTLYEVVSATPQGKIELTIGNPYMMVNGQQQEIEPGKGTVPVVTNGRTFLPIKGVVVAMGGTVSWDAITQKITINYNNTSIVMQIGSQDVMVNGVLKKMDVAPYISSTGSTMVPVRFVGEFLGCSVNWDEAQKKITIYY